MIVLYTPVHQLHDPTLEYYDGQATPHAEQPARISSILDACQDLGLPIRAVKTPLGRQQLSVLHSKHYIDFLQNKCTGVAEGTQLLPSVFIKDTYTPLTRHTSDAARHAAGLAVTAAEMVAVGQEQAVYALCRPPGHHAEQDSMMGYCYYNNAAFAAQHLAANGRRVAILDIDYHHGNGTQQLFYDRSDVLYISIHADPAQSFPYGSGFANERGVREGFGYNRNFPLARSTTPQRYLQTLRQAIRAARQFAPDFMVLSLGFDTYLHDPIGNLGLDTADYAAIGAQIADGLRLPTVIVQEGGYNVGALGTLSAHFLRGYMRSAP